MPSNAMTARQLAEQLNEIADAHGDVPVIFATEGRLIAIDGRNVNVMTEVIGQRLQSPALVIGLQRDDQSRVRNSPGAVFQANAGGDGWSTNRSEAPEGEDLDVWKREGGFDIGRREGEAWFVREGAEEWPRRPIQIVTRGILAWRLRRG